MSSRSSKNYNPRETYAATYRTHGPLTPYAKGAWFCAAPVMATRSLEALQIPHGRVFMANSDWAQGWRGFIDGAIEQGARAASTIKFALQREDAAPNFRL